MNGKSLLDERPAATKKINKIKRGWGLRKFIGLDNKRKVRPVTKQLKKWGWIKKVYMTRQQKKSKTGDKINTKS